MNKKKLILGTRGSALALVQSKLFADALQKIHPSLQIEFKKITTSGDRIQDRFLNQVGGKGLFVKEIEQALISKEIDFAVHSLKDMPAILPEELELGCFPERLDPDDVLITKEGFPLSNLKEGVVIGTNSLRRRLQIQKLKPNVKFEMLRGNIDTRIKRLQNGDFDGIVLAKAGLKRLGADLSFAVDLPIIPAPGQGTLAIEIRKDESWIKELLKPLHHEATELASKAERQVMRLLGGSCNLPLGVFGEIRQSKLHLIAFIASPDGNHWIEECLSGSTDDPTNLADQLVEKFWQRGAKKIVEEIEKFSGET